MVQQLLASRIKRHARKRRVDRPQHHKGPNSRCHALVPDGFRLLIALIRQHPVVIQNRVVFFVDGPRQLRPGRIQGIDAAEAQRAIAARSSIELGNGYGHGRVRGVRRGSADGKGNGTRVVQKIGFRYAAGRYADRGFIAAGSKGITGFRKLDIGIGLESADGALAGFFPDGLAVLRDRCDDLQSCAAQVHCAVVQRDPADFEGLVGRDRINAKLQIIERGSADVQILNRKIRRGVFVVGTGGVLLQLCAVGFQNGKAFEPPRERRGIVQLPAVGAEAVEHPVHHHDAQPIRRLAAQCAVVFIGIRIGNENGGIGFLAVGAGGRVVQIAPERDSVAADAERGEIVADGNADGAVALQRVKHRPQIVDVVGNFIGLVQTVGGILGKILSGFARRAQLRPAVIALHGVIAVEEPVQPVCIRAARVCKR